MLQTRVPSDSVRREKASDAELLDAITRDLRAIYTDIIRAPLPPDLAAALGRLERRSEAAARPRERSELRVA